METRYEVAQEQLSENDIVVSRYSRQAAVILPGIAWECPEMLTKLAIEYGKKSGTAE